MSWVDNGDSGGEGDVSGVVVSSCEAAQGTGKRRRRRRHCGRARVGLELQVVTRKHSSHPCILLVKPLFRQAISCATPAYTETGDVCTTLYTCRGIARLDSCLRQR